MICFGQIYYYIHNEISPTPNDWHKDIIKLLATNKLITELKDIEIYGGEKMTKEELECLLRDIECILNENGKELFYEFLYNKNKEIADLQSQLDQANERLRGAIIPKFKSEDIAYRISFFTKKVEKVAIIRTHIDTGRSCEIYYTIAILEDEQTFNDITPYFNISQEPEDELYATKAEAEKRLQEEAGH